VAKLFTGIGVPAPETTPSVKDTVTAVFGVPLAAKAAAVGDPDMEAPLRVVTVLSGAIVTVSADVVLIVPKFNGAVCATATV
jgi:hypothetical protein